MRQVHRAGEKVFVDYSGKRPCIVDQLTGEVTEVELFVAVLGASNYTFADVTRSQKLGDFVASNIRALEYFGGVPLVLVPDQLRSAVSGPDRYDPEINPTYAEFAQHYGIAVVPARPMKPKDKAKVEGAVLIAQRWILACLRNRTFFSLDELSEAVAELLERLNTRPFKKLDGCRRSAFEQLDQPVLRPLPPTRYEVGMWAKAKVNIDYCVELDGMLYSVPCTLVGSRVELRSTAAVVEILLGNKRVASHRRCYGRKGTATIVEEHSGLTAAAYSDQRSWSVTPVLRSSWCTQASTSDGPAPGGACPRGSARPVARQQGPGWMPSRQCARAAKHRTAGATWADGGGSDLSSAEQIGMMVDHEWTARETGAWACCSRTPKIPANACVEMLLPYWRDRRTNMPLPLACEEVSEMISWVLALPELADEVLAELRASPGDQLKGGHTLIYQWTQDGAWVVAHPSAAAGILAFLAGSRSISEHMADDDLVVLKRADDAGARRDDLLVAAEGLVRLSCHAAVAFVEQLRARD